MNILKDKVNEFFTKWEKIIKESRMENATAKATTVSDISEREMYERDQRLSCLAHAIDVNRIEGDPSNILNRAKSYYDFIEKGK